MTLSEATRIEFDDARELVRDIFFNARWHDREVLAAKEALFGEGDGDDERHDNLMQAIDSLYAAIAPIAVRRAEQLDMLLPNGQSDIDYLFAHDSAKELAYLRAIFEEAGIGERFVG